MYVARILWRILCTINGISFIYGIRYEGADRVRGRGEKRGREGGDEGEGGGRRGAGGGRRGGGRREKRGREEGEVRKKGREENFARAKRAPLQKGGGRRGGGRGEVRGREGERPTPLSTPSDMDIRYTTIFAVLSVHCVSQTFTSICNTAFSHCNFLGNFFSEITRQIGWRSHKIDQNSGGILRNACVSCETYLCVTTKIL